MRWAPSPCPYSRAYHYVEVLDKEHGDQPVYLFNTHFGLKPSKDTSGNTLSSANATQLWKALLAKQATFADCFISGIGPTQESDDTLEE